MRILKRGTKTKNRPQIQNHTGGGKISDIFRSQGWGDKAPIACKHASINIHDRPETDGEERSKTRKRATWRNEKRDGIKSVCEESDN